MDAFGQFTFDGFRFDSRTGQLWRDGREIKLTPRTTAVLRALRPPHRIMVILEGESLLNDATALLIFGADKIPKLARGFGRSLGEFKKAKEDFEKEISAAATEQEKKPTSEAPKIAGTLPEEVKPIPTTTVTASDELTKKS